jgi:hypothetical protein
MKLLAFILVIALGAPPLQAGVCDMGADPGQETQQSTAHPGADDHDCCDTEKADEPEGCEGGMDCCPCYVSLSVLPTFPRIAGGTLNTLVADRLTGVLLPSHASPPFRPPIA